MGSSVQANCPSGVDMQIMIGGGMMDHKTNCRFPYCCENCHSLVEANVLAEKLRCPSLACRLVCSRGCVAISSGRAIARTAEAVPQSRRAGAARTAAPSLARRRRGLDVCVIIPAPQNEVFEGLLGVFLAIPAGEHPDVHGLSRFWGLVEHGTVDGAVMEEYDVARLRFDHRCLLQQEPLVEGGARVVGSAVAGRLPR